MCESILSFSNEIDSQKVIECRDHGLNSLFDAKKLPKINIVSEVYPSS